MAELTLDHISKTYTGHAKRDTPPKAVDDISFTVKDKEFMVIVGPSGCGKSTLLRMIAGLEDISEGVLSIDGKRMNELSPKDRDIAMVFQNYALYPHMTVYDNLAFGLKLKRCSKTEIRSRVMQTAELLEIQEMLQRRPKLLSGGQRQRVAIGRAIIRRPAIFLFDEPLSNLDAKLRTQMRIELQKLHRKIGATIVYVTHDQTEAMTLGDRIAVLSKGRLMQLNTPMHLYSQPANKFVAGFIGSPSMNFLRGVIEDNGGAPRDLDSAPRDHDGAPRDLDSAPRDHDGAPRDSAAHDHDGYTFVHETGLCRIPLGPTIPQKVRHYIGQPVTLGIRPESILIGSAAPGQHDCEVIAVENMGNEQLIYLSLADQTLIARRPPSASATTGAVVRIAFIPDQIYYLDELSGRVIT
jgi:multiple sugar transport system ATP-binding protein